MRGHRECDERRSEIVLKYRLTEAHAHMYQTERRRTTVMACVWQVNGEGGGFASLSSPAGECFTLSVCKLWVVWVEERIRQEINFSLHIVKRRLKRKIHPFLLSAS